MRGSRRSWTSCWRSSATGADNSGGPGRCGSRSYFSHSGSANSWRTGWRRCDGGSRCSCCRSGRNFCFSRSRSFGCCSRRRSGCGGKSSRRCSSQGVSDSFSSSDCSRLIRRCRRKGNFFPSAKRYSLSLSSRLFPPLHASHRQPYPRVMAGVLFLFCGTVWASSLFESL